MTTPIGVGSGSTTAQQTRGQKQAANTTMFVFIIFIVYIKSIKTYQIVNCKCFVQYQESTVAIRPDIAIAAALPPPPKQLHCCALPFFVWEWGRGGKLFGNARGVIFF
jgi:hypothetical protein